MTDDEILIEAKRRYTIGCKSKCLVVDGLFEIDESVVFRLEGGHIYSYKEGKLYHKHYDSRTKRWADAEGVMSYSYEIY